MVFIPKAGKIYVIVFIKNNGKTDRHLCKSILTPRNFCEPQHSYQKGRSVEIAPHDVLGTVESAIDTLDCTEGIIAFSNVKISSILESLGDLNIDQLIIRWTENTLKDRVVISGLGIDILKKLLIRGALQLGVIPPLLWNLVANKILFKLNHKYINVVAYADDNILLIKDKFVFTLNELMESKLDTTKMG